MNEYLIVYAFIGYSFFMLFLGAALSSWTDNTLKIPFYNSVFRITLWSVVWPACVLFVIYIIIFGVPSWAKTNTATKKSDSSV